MYFSAIFLMELSWNSATKYFKIHASSIGHESLGGLATGNVAVVHGFAFGNTMVRDMMPKITVDWFFR